jgi:hypothetical protein
VGPTNKQDGSGSPSTSKDGSEQTEATGVKDGLTENGPSTGPNSNALYLSAVAIVAIVGVVVISTWDSANSSAVIGLMNLATGAVGGMAGVALQKRS